MLAIHLMIIPMTRLPQKSCSFFIESFSLLYVVNQNKCFQQLKTLSQIFFVLFCWKFWFLPLIQTCKILNEQNSRRTPTLPQAALLLVLGYEGASGIWLPTGLCHLTGHMREHGKCAATGETCGHESLSNYSLDQNRLAAFLSSGIICT